MLRFKRTVCTATLFCLLLVPALALAQGTKLQAKAAVDVPMLFNGPTPAVEVMVNGKGPFRFAIDTGAAGQARVDSSLGQRLGLQPAGKIMAGDGSGMNAREVDLVKLDSISFGGLEFRNVEAPMRDYNRMMPPNAPHLDGILGFNLFADYLLTLDYAGKRVRVERGELPRADGAEILDFKTERGVPTVELEVGALKVSAHIDSGNARSEITMPGSLIEKLSLAAPPRVVGRARTTSNEFEISEAPLKGSVRLGRQEITGPNITFADIFKEANIGSRLLQQFTLTFDQKNNRVRIQRQR